MTDDAALDSPNVHASRPTVRDGVSTLWIADSQQVDAPEPATVGRFVVLGRIGHGAMGKVLRAYDSTLLREVALKLVYAPGAAASARMLREAQALAQLNHPNVVAIYDVGEQNGNVFIAMEFVRGRTLRQWLEERERSWRDIVEVVREAGRGLAAAHRAGLVHRDVKPDNILVADDGRVRMADFGLARADRFAPDPEHEGELASASDPSLRAPLTQTGAVLGTLAYMAPEQHLGAVADASSDQYALCVTLYEALFRRRPYVASAADLPMAKLAGDARVPDKTRVPRVIARAVLRGLAPSPGDRWPSIDALLDQLGRDPQRARRRGLLLAGALVTVAGVLGARHLERQRIAAACVAEGDEIDRVWNDDARARVREGILAAPTAAAEVTAVNVMPWLDEQAERWRLGRTEACLDGRLRDVSTPAVLELSQSCFDERRDELEAFADALAHADIESVHLAVTAAASLTPVEPCRDADLLMRMPTPPHEQREQVRSVRGAIARAWALGQGGRSEDASTSARAAFDRAEALAWAPLVAAARYRVAVALSRSGELTGAEQEAEAAFVEAGASGSWDVATDACDQLVWTVGMQLDRYPDALRWSRMREIAVANLGAVDELREARHLYRVAFVHLALGDRDRARALDERALEILERRLGPEHPDVAAVLFALATVRQAAGELAEAALLHQRSLEMRERALGPDHPDVAQSLVGLAGIDLFMGEGAAARPKLERALAIVEAAGGPEHPSAGVALLHLGMLDASAGRYDAARQQLERSVAILERAAGGQNVDAATALRTLANVRAVTGDLAIAKELHARALVVTEQRLGPDHLDVATHLDDLAIVHGMLGDFARATELHERALAIVERSLGPQSPHLVNILDNLAADYTETKRYAEARALLERSLEVKRQVFEPTHPAVAYSLVGLGDLDLREGRPADAVGHYERALAIQAMHDTPPQEVAAARFKLAQALWSSKAERARAFELAQRASEAMRTAGPGAAALRDEIDAWLAEHRTR